MVIARAQAQSKKVKLPHVMTIPTKKALNPYLEDELSQNLWGVLGKSRGVKRIKMNF